MRGCVRHGCRCCRQNPPVGGITCAVPYQEHSTFRESVSLQAPLIGVEAWRRCSRTEKGFKWEWIGREASLDRMLWSIAHSGAEFLIKGDLSRLRECGGEECGWLFEDTSRNRSRQWCHMQDCGNLAKVRRFRTRLRSSGKIKR